MKLDDVRIVQKPLVPASPADIDGVESRLWISFPEGYRDYVTRLGEGVLGSFVRIYPPWRIESELVDWRRRIQKYWFWDASRDLLPKERALECVIVGDTLNGDELVFHPTRRNRLFVLPRDGEQAFEAGVDLLSAVDWMCGSGQLVDEFPGLDFEPFDSRQQQAAESGAEGAEAPEGESLADLTGMGKRWAERKSARKKADKDLRKLINKLKSQFGANRASELRYEAIVLDGNFPFDPGYVAVFRIKDESSRLEVGTFTWYKNESSYGSEYEPNEANLAKLVLPK